MPMTAFDPLRSFATGAIPALMKNLGPMFVVMLAANVLLLMGLAATVSGLALVVVGFPVAWLGWSGAVLTLAAFAARHLLARTMLPP